MKPEDLRAVEDEAIREVVRMQEQAGLQSATDGEFRRASWHMDFIYQLGGISPAQQYIKVHFRNAAGNTRVRIDRPWSSKIVTSATPALLNSSATRSRPVCTVCIVYIV